MSDRQGGYPADGGRKLTDWNGKVIGHGRAKCRRVNPHERGAWISNERCSYQFEIDGRWYHGRGRGDGVSVLLRPMKKKPMGFRGARARRKRKRK